MTKSDLIDAMKDFPDDMPVKVYGRDDHEDLTEVTEICPTQIGPAENYLLLS